MTFTDAGGAELDIDPYEGKLEFSICADGYEDRDGHAYLRMLCAQMTRGQAQEIAIGITCWLEDSA